jgi:hypothetical protein
MTLKNLITIIFLIGLYSCKDTSDTSHDSTNQTKDFSIKNSQRSGIGYIDTNGVGYTYLWITSTITNNSPLPMHLEIDFSNGNTYSSGADISQTFLLPKKWVTPEKYLPPASKKIELGMSNELKWFLDRVDKTSISFDTVLKSKENCTLTFGLLDRTKIDLPFNIGLNAPKASSTTMTLGLSFDRPQDEHYLIPCGQITFTDN